MDKSAIKDPMTIRVRVLPGGTRIRVETEDRKEGLECNRDHSDWAAITAGARQASPGPGGRTIRFEWQETLFTVARADFEEYLRQVKEREKEDEEKKKKKPI